MNNIELPQKITVIIPVQEYRKEKYADPTNCYLAEQLKLLGYDSKVCYLDTQITLPFSNEQATYDYTSRFDSMILQDSFAKGKPLSITLIKR